MTRQITIRQWNQARALRQKGLTYPAIAQQLGLTIHQVSRAAKDVPVPRPHTKLVPAVRAEIILFYMNNYPVEEIARKCKVSTSSVYYVLWQDDVMPRRARQPLSQEIASYIIRRRHEGASWRSICRETSLSFNTVRLYVDRYRMQEKWKLLSLAQYTKALTQPTRSGKRPDPSDLTLGVKSSSSASPPADGHSTEQLIQVSPTSNHSSYRRKRSQLHTIVSSLLRETNSLEETQSVPNPESPHLTIYSDF